MKEIRMGVVGSRNYHDYEFVKKYLDKFKNATDNLVIVSGGADGVDSLAKRYAEENNLRYVEFSANWQLHGNSAGPIRNRQIVNYSDFIIAFHGANSKGTQSTINIAKEVGKKVMVVDI